MVQHDETLDVELLAISVSFVWQHDPMIRSVCRARAIPYLFLSKPRETPMTQIELHRVFSNLHQRLARHCFSLFLVQYSMSLNIYMCVVLLLGNPRMFEFLSLDVNRFGA